MASDHRPTMPAPIAYKPTGEPVTDLAGLPCIECPAAVRVSADTLHVDGWRLPISTMPDPVVHHVLGWLRSWRDSSRDYEWAAHLTGLILEQKRMHGS